MDEFWLFKLYQINILYLKAFLYYWNMFFLEILTAFYGLSYFSIISGKENPKNAFVILTNGWILAIQALSNQHFLHLKAITNY